MEGNVLFNDGLDTFYFYGYMGERKMFYLMTHSNFLIFTVIWCQTYGKGPLR